MSLRIKRGKKFPGEAGSFLVERLALLKATDCIVENKGPFHLGVPVFCIVYSRMMRVCVRVRVHGGRGRQLLAKTYCSVA